MATNQQLVLPAAAPRGPYDYGARSSGEAHGVVLTKRRVVDLILDLAGYAAGRDLTRLALLEPACGRGAFLVPAVERLLDSARRAGVAPRDLTRAVLAYDVDPAHVAASRHAVATALRAGGVPARAARRLAGAWVVEGDFLLAATGRTFDAVVGNPPYVRIEQLAPDLQARYRARYATLFDRADLYVAFVERGLSLLAPEGVLAFVCADRWTLNRYGAPLRRLISRDHAVRWYVDLHGASPFESDVIAYPAIFAIGRAPGGPVRVARLRDGSPGEVARLRAWAHDARRGGRAARPGAPPPRGLDAATYPTWFEGDAPWTLASPEHLAALRALEARHAPLEADGATRVGIGVATGNDGVFIVPDSADVEPERLVPLVMREDVVDGVIRNARRCVLDPFAPEGGLVDLRGYPRLARYLATHEAALRRRHVARRRPGQWFRTIDRIHPDLLRTPKLLIPDIAGSCQVAYDPGHFYPHHNLYHVTSSAWDLEALGGLLSSRVALFFVWSYAVKMRGGYLRFQAQYLRRIRVPSAASLPPRLARALRAAFRARDFATLDALALEAYGLASLPVFDFVDTRT